VPLAASQRLKAGVIAAAGYPLIASLGWTLTWKTAGEHHARQILRGGAAPILALWHGRILASTLYWRDRGIVALTSENFDGEWTARLMRRFGYRAARGSTSHGGARALVQMRRELAAGQAVAFTVDGPRGPAWIAQPGAVWLAGATGHPILPFHIEADRCWTLRTWDAAQVPQPFGTVAVVIGAPMQVPGTDAEVVEQHRRDLEIILNDLRARARDLALSQAPLA
jgi:lysophospholipid acyltransferase (LPLAT)-like uncharacterized protein